MNLINFIKNNLFIQNFFSYLAALPHPFLENTLAKYLAIKKAMFMTYVDETNGSYLEFGVFTGNSFNFAMRINRKMEKHFKKKLNNEFIGFDSFEGFGEISEHDKNSAFTNSIFQVNEKKVIKNIKKNSKGQNFRLIKGFYKDTLKNKTSSDLGINKSRIIMIDCDLKDSTKLALEFSKPSLQNGTIIIFDDLNYYKGSIKKGEFGAFEEFKKDNPEIVFRRIFDYGYSGRAYVVCSIN